MSVDLSANLLAYEPVFLARLATVAVLAEVGGYAEFDRALNGGDVDDAGSPDGMKLPGAYLLYGGTFKTGQPKGGDHNRPLFVSQDWQVLVLARPVVARDGSTSLSPLGEAMAAILAVFKDWTPEGANDPVEHIWPEDDAIVSYGNGLVNAALLFRVKFTLH